MPITFNEKVASLLLKEIRELLTSTLLSGEYPASFRTLSEYISWLQKVERALRLRMRLDEKLTREEHYEMTQTLHELIDNLAIISI